MCYAWYGLSDVESPKDPSSGIRLWPRRPQHARFVSIGSEWRIRAKSSGLIAALESGFGFFLDFSGAGTDFLPFIQVLSVGVVSQPSGLGCQNTRLLPQFEPRLLQQILEEVSDSYKDTDCHVGCRRSGRPWCGFA